MAFEFKPATLRKHKARVALAGFEGTGKSRTGLGILRGLVGPDGRIAGIDTEHDRLLYYAGRYPGTNQPTGFDHLGLVDYALEFYMEALQVAARARYDGVFIDSVSHGYEGQNGLLEFVGRIGEDSGDTFGAGWRKATPLQKRFIDAILSYPGHIVLTVRTKVAYVVELNEKGKNEPRKVGTKPIQREGFFYEFDLIGSMDQAHTLTIQKATGVLDFLDGAVILRPDGIALGQQIIAKLNNMPGEWETPAFARKFQHNGKLIETKGVVQETYLQVLDRAVQYDKATKQNGAAKSQLLARYKVGSVTQLTEEQAVEFIEFMEPVIVAARDVAEKGAA